MFHDPTCGSHEAGWRDLERILKRVVRARYFIRNGSQKDRQSDTCFDREWRYRGTQDDVRRRRRESEGSGEFAETRGCNLPANSVSFKFNSLNLISTLYVNQGIDYLRI